MLLLGPASPDPSDSRAGPLLNPRLAPSSRRGSFCLIDGGQEGPPKARICCPSSRLVSARGLDGKSSNSPRPNRRGFSCDRTLWVASFPSAFIKEGADFR
jgi:hypothetical protein